MIGSFQEIFNPTPEQLKNQHELYLKIFKELTAEKGCVTCQYAYHVSDDEIGCYFNNEDPGIWIKNCDDWEERDDI